MATSSTPENLSRTPLFDVHVRAGARMVPFAGWEMPLTYEGQLAEHLAVRRGVGLFDVSHMGQVRFRGPQALALLQLLVPGNIAALKDTQAKYTHLCTDTGGVVDDLIISRISATEYLAVVNAGTRAKDVQWMRDKARILGFGDVEIIDESPNWAMIAVQGPGAFDMLESVVPHGKWSATPAFTLHPFLHNGELHYLSRTGYTGEVGGELICPAPEAEFWWHELVAAGGKPCGLAARDSLRLEAGYCLYGQDLSESTSPVEAGLSWTVGWKKEEKFLGRTILEKQKADGPARRLVGLRTDTRRPLRHGDKIVSAGKEVGEITSGGFSPILEKGIGLAYVESAALGETPVVLSRGSEIPVEIVKPPFVKTSLNP